VAHEIQLMIGANPYVMYAKEYYIFLPTPPVEPRTFYGSHPPKVHTNKFLCPSLNHSFILETCIAPLQETTTQRRLTKFN